MLAKIYLQKLLELHSTIWKSLAWLLLYCYIFGTFPVVQFKSDLEFRIYSRISREILDKIWHIFLQFDLYAGPKFGLLKHNIFHYLCVLETSKPCNRKINKLNFGHFFQLIFPIQLIRGSTYTRVYTVTQKSSLIILSKFFTRSPTVSSKKYWIRYKAKDQTRWYDHKLHKAKEKMESYWKKWLMEKSNKILHYWCIIILFLYLQLFLLKFNFINCLSKMYIVIKFTLHIVKLHKHRHLMYLFGHCYEVYFSPKWFK